MDTEDLQGQVREQTRERIERAYAEAYTRLHDICANASNSSAWLATKKEAEAALDRIIDEARAAQIARFLGPHRGDNP